MMSEISSKRRQTIERPSQDRQHTRYNTRNTNTSYHDRENIRVNLLNLYGEEILQQSRSFEKLRTKKARLICDLTFLRRCREQHLVPTSCKLSYHTKTTKTSRILHKAGQALLRDSIQRTRKELSQLDIQVMKLHLSLSSKIHPTIWQKIETLAAFRAENDAIYRTKKQKNKVERLQSNQQSHILQLPPLQVVHNLSDKHLSEAEIRVLTKGFNYAITPSRIPVEKIICGVETALYTLDHNTAEAIRQDVCSALRQAKPPNRNLSGEELQALKSLSKDDSVVILPADKGNATVVLNKQDYNNKMETLLEDISYKAIATDPTTYLEKTTKAKINAAPLDEQTKKRIIPREKSSKCPKIYGLPKIHKPDVPLRPIVSSIGSPTQALAKYLADQLNPYAENIASHVKNADHFLQLIKNVKINNTDILVSFDVTSLFTQVPVEETISIIKNKYQPPNHVVNLTHHCFKNTYFMFNNQRYKQLEGAPMGSPLSPILANLFMEEFETKALNTAECKPKLWLRYVDDTFAIWTHGKEKLEEFLLHLNNIHPKIKFTMEIEKANQLAFLDILVIKKQDGSLGHTVYRKATHTNRYLNAQSHHHPAQLQSVVQSLVERSKRLADHENIQTETNKIRDILLTNGFSRQNINRAIHNKNKNQTRSEEITQKAYLPYVRGTTDKIKNILRKYKIETIFTTDKKISKILGNPKDKIPLEEQGVYEIPCGECDSSYIGQTNRRVSVRREEHRNAVRIKQATSSLAQHTLMTGHTIDFDEAKTIISSEHLPTRIIREAIEIEKRPNNLNKRDDGQRLPATWKLALASVKDRQPSSTTDNRGQTVSMRAPTTTPTRTLIGAPSGRHAASGTHINRHTTDLAQSPVASRTRSARR